MRAEGALEEAKRLGALCDSSEVDMVLIAGSVARGLADQSSDIDLYVYRPGAEAMHSLSAAMQPSGARLVFGVPTSTGRFEKFRLADLYVDVEQVSSTTLGDTVDRIEAAKVTAEDIKVAAGISDAIAVVGGNTLTAWRSPTVESTDDGSALLSEILDLVDEHIDGADTRVARFALHLST